MRNLIEEESDLLFDCGRSGHKLTRDNNSAVKRNQCSDSVTTILEVEDMETAPSAQKNMRLHSCDTVTKEDYRRREVFESGKKRQS